MSTIISAPYTFEQISAIASAQLPGDRLATYLAYETGITAYEIATLRPWGCRLVDPDSKFPSNRFAGRKVFLRYSVETPVGDSREVAVGELLAGQLECARLGRPFATFESDNRVLCGYNIGFGKSWSASFRHASKSILGYSNGTHGIRQAYVLDRNVELIDAGFSGVDRLSILSAETGCDTERIEQLLTTGKDSRSVIAA